VGPATVVVAAAAEWRPELTDGLNCLSLHQKHLLDRHRGRGRQVLLLGYLFLLSGSLLLSTPSSSAPVL
jgi:hypothetical protein